MGNQASQHVIQTTQHQRNNNVPKPPLHFYKNNQTIPYPQKIVVQQKPISRQPNNIQKPSGNLRYNNIPQPVEVVTHRENVLPPQRQTGVFMPYPVSSGNENTPKRQNPMSNKIVPSSNLDLRNVNYNNVNETIQKFQSQQEIDEQKFLKKQEEEKKKFYKSHNEKFDKFQQELNNFEKTYNPFKILKLNYDADETQIKKSYRKLSLKYHPDRPDGNEQKFQLITKAYIYLLNKIKETRGTKSHNDLRKDAQNYFENEPSSIFIPTFTSRIGNILPLSNLINVSPPKQKKRTKPPIGPSHIEANVQNAYFPNINKFRNVTIILTITFIISLNIYAIRLYALYNFCCISLN